jgi:predicted CoA-binding protein
MSKNTLVIGASIKPERYSNKAINMLIDNNITVKAIGVKSGELRGITIEKDLISFDDIHTVTMYVNPKIQVNYYDYILDLKPKRVLFNPGTENLEFQEILEKNNIEVENACTLVLLNTNQY